jgi:hypothetical protein
LQKKNGQFSVLSKQNQVNGRLFAPLMMALSVKLWHTMLKRRLKEHGIYIQQHPAKVQQHLENSAGHKAKLQSVGVFLHPPLIVRLTYGTFRGSYPPPKRFDLLKF